MLGPYLGDERRALCRLLSVFPAAWKGCRPGWRAAAFSGARKFRRARNPKTLACRVQFACTGVLRSELAAVTLPKAKRPTSLCQNGVHMLYFSWFSRFVTARISLRRKVL